MILFKTTTHLQKHLQKLHTENVTVGFVPTMGALHSGHLSLINECKKQCDITVCSIFINPTQFNDKKDFEKYPVTIENDIYLLETNKTDILFLPSVEEIYNEGLHQLQHFDLGYLENILEGKYRPGHFQGVCNVVYRLLGNVKPDTIFLGRKDYQQYLILKKMMQEFYADISIYVVDIAREKNGLAMSSRNMRLSDEARVKAAAIYKTLEFIKQNIFNINIDELKAQSAKKILQSGFETVDYIEICDAETLFPVTEVSEGKKLIVLVAAYIEDVRLIDNLILN
ncbi:MAG: pantoate--beta-alanine ligase [Parafilimonas sp.]